MKRAPLHPNRGPDGRRGNAFLAAADVPAAPKVSVRWRQVACTHPDCLAPVGSGCVSAAGASRGTPHRERYRAAVRAGLVERGSVKDRERAEREKDRPKCPECGRGLVPTKAERLPHHRTSPSRLGVPCIGAGRKVQTTP